MQNNHFALIVLTLGMFLVTGCGVGHIGKYTPKRRQYKSPVNFSKSSSKALNGSLFNANSSSAYIFADQRARRAGDIVTVVVREEADASRKAETDLRRSAASSLTIEALFTLMKTAGIPSNLLSGSQKSDFLGRGQTSRSERLEATVPAIVREVLPNGNLFIEGHRVVLVNEEEHHFYISGVIRPIDIANDNTVISSQVADAEVEFTGRGVISEKQRPGWLQRGLDFIAPF
jgi:flagellar L-ring protein precursor FlgH